MKLSLSLTLALAFSFGHSTALISGQAPDDKGPSWLDILRNDPRLKTPMTLNFVPKPGTDELFAMVRTATGVTLNVADEPEDGKIVLGNMSGKAPAWKVMQQIATTQFIDGRWEKAGDGYVLHGSPKVTLSVEGEQKHAAAKKTLQEAVAKKSEALKQFPLRSDARLHAKLSVTDDNPALADLLDRLQRSTKLTFTLADNLEYHEPRLGGVKLPNVHACILMEWLATKDLDDGRWEKTETGYQLEGTSRSLRTPPPRVIAWRWVIAMMVGFSLVTTGGVVLYRRRARTLAAAPPKG